MKMSPSNHLDLLFRFDRGLKLREAIFESVKEGDFVVDAGCGTGLLSIWAAQAGAGRVLAVDLADLTTAKLLARENDCLEKVEFVQSNLSHLDPDSHCDVLIAMVYYNDPRRDEQQHVMKHGLCSQLLNDNGLLIPNKVEYLAYASEWVSQDISTTYADIDRKVSMMEQRYDLSMQTLAEEARARPNPAWFPTRTGTGILDRPDARLLSAGTRFTTIDYLKSLPGYPEQITFHITSSGVMNTVIFVQNLYYKDKLIFSNESVSWINNPLLCKAGSNLTVCVDENWRKRNVLSLNELV